MKSWPDALGRSAHHGPLGELVAAIEPTTEADPVALLFALLTMFGSAAGRGSYAVVEETQHHPRLFSVLAGASAASKKGTTNAKATAAMRELDPDWVRSCRISGLSSGEGLVEDIRDGSDDDDGVDDKRRLAVCSEFGGLLRVLNRENNTLSAFLRDAWDGLDLRVMTRKDGGLRATEPHVSLIGHVTLPELRKNLGEIESSNGFANRHLFVLVRRSKSLPFGGHTPEIPEALWGQLRQALDFAKSAGLISWGSSGRGPWEAFYNTFDATPRLGLWGSITSRGQAQTLRLALIYALLDRSKTIDAEHVHAAVECWRFCEQSARVIWGDSLGDREADRIMDALQVAGAKGLRRTEIADVFSRNIPAGRIDSALQLLKQTGRVSMTLERTGGRSAERWSYTPPQNERNERNGERVPRPAGDTPFVSFLSSPVDPN